jgi:hypothetical protein
MRLDLERVKRNVHEADTEDLLDRVTVYRAGMEPEALELIEEELRARNVLAADVEAHAERRRREITLLPDGTAARCSFCERPALAEAWGWHRLWGVLPLFPRFYYYCDRHGLDVGVEASGPSDLTPRGDPPPLG